MTVAIVTGSAGLVGSETVEHFAGLGWDVIGIDNGMRAHFLGEGASTAWARERLIRQIPFYRHVDADIRDAEEMLKLFETYKGDIALVVHTAAQPSHDWAARNPAVDFTTNANGTLNLLEACRRTAPDAVFIFTSTNKVYGDLPNHLPLLELDTRWEISPSHVYQQGIPETMSIDSSLHSLFGASKVAADILVQEYGRYFGMRTVCFRGGCLTGPNHSGAELHGFLSHLMKCAVLGQPYTIFGYKGKQVRDNIHSADLVRAFHCFFEKPRSAAVYNIGGGRHSNCSVLEAIALCDRITGKPLRTRYIDENRRGDHIWWISDVAHFQQDYPEWSLEYDVPKIMQEMYERNRSRWSEECTIGARKTSLVS
jgi:CDP-paratose 2-epimerase